MIESRRIWMKSNIEKAVNNYTGEERGKGRTTNPPNWITPNDKPSKSSTKKDKK